MFSTKQIVNAINRSIQGRENISAHVQSLIYWHRPALTAAVLAVVEIVFLLVRLTNCNSVTVICLTLGTLGVLNVTQNVFPSILDKVFSFQTPEVPENSPLRIRNNSEIAAYFTTVFSLFIGIIQYIMTSTDLVHTIVSLVALSFITITLAILGDFWTIFLIFHVVFVLPGIILQPQVYPIIFGHPFNEVAEEKVNENDDDETLDAPPATICEDDEPAEKEKEKEE